MKLKELIKKYGRWYGKWFFNLMFNNITNIEKRKFLMESFLFGIIFVISSFASILMVINTSEFSIIETFSRGFMLIVWILLIMWRIFETKGLFHWLYITLVFNIFFKRVGLIKTELLSNVILDIYLAFIIIYILVYKLFDIGDKVDKRRSLQVINTLRKIKLFAIFDDYMIKLKNETRTNSNKI